MVDTHSPSIIGLKTCERLDLIKRVYLINDVDPNLLEEFAGTFGDNGCHLVSKNLKLTRL